MGLPLVNGQARENLPLTGTVASFIVAAMRIGIVSDTHLPNLIRTLDELGPEPARFFSSVDLILHSGDLTSPMVLDWLERFAPVVCTTGNNDPIADQRCQECHIMEVHGWRLGMVHSLRRGFRPVSELQRLFPTPVDIMVAGDTHQERLEYRDGVVVLNSGSPTFPQHKDLRLGTVGLLELAPHRLRADILLLGQTSGRPNPGRPMSLTIHDDKVVASDLSASPS
jgi:putative phosphoesterase